MQNVWLWLKSLIETDINTETVAEIEQFFFQLSHNACYEQIQGKFEAAFNAAHDRCSFRRGRGSRHRSIPREYRHWYENTGSLFKRLWDDLEIRNYYSAFEQVHVQGSPIYPSQALFKPPPDDYSLKDDYWFLSGRADELRPLRDAVHEFLKTIGVVQEYHLLLAAIIEEFLRKDPCGERPGFEELGEYLDSETIEYDAERIQRLYDVFGRPTCYMGNYIIDALIEEERYSEETRHFRSRPELETNDPIVRRFLALFDEPLTSSTTRLMQGGHPYILSELNRQLEPIRTFLSTEDEDMNSRMDVGFFLEEPLADEMELEFGSLEDWTKAQATSRCPIFAGCWEPDTIVPAALKLISVSNPSYGTEYAVLTSGSGAAGSRQFLSQPAKMILSWTFCQYNLMFLQGLLAGFADMRKPSFAELTLAPDTVKTELQKIAQVCYRSYYRKTRTPDARGMLLEGITSEIFAVYAICRLAKPFSDGRKWLSHKEAKEHYQEVIDAAQRIFTFCKRVDQARWPNTDALLSKLKESADEGEYQPARDWQSNYRIIRSNNSYNKFYQAHWPQEARRVAAAMAAAATHAIASMDEDAELAREALKDWPQADKPQIIYRRKGQVAAALEHFDEAIADYQTAKALAPDNAQLLRELASLYMRTGRFDEAIAELQTAEALAPDNAQLLRELASLYMRTGRFDEAIAELQTAEALAPDNADGLYHLAHIYAQQGKNLEEAVLFAQRAKTLWEEEEASVTQKVSLVCTRQVLGWLYLQQGKVEKALEVLEDPDLHNVPSLQFYLVLGDAYEAAEHQEDAEQAWQAGWRFANMPQFQEYVKNECTPFEATQYAAHRTELRERLDIQENAS